MNPDNEETAILEGDESVEVSELDSTVNESVPISDIEVVSDPPMEKVEVESEAIQETVPEESQVNTPDPVTEQTALPDEYLQRFDNLDDAISKISEASVKTAKEVYELHRLYHSEYIKRLGSMQKELDAYHEIDKGRYLDGILTDLSQFYNDYSFITQNVTDSKVLDTLNHLFEDLVDIMEKHGATKLKSQSGDKRHNRHCQVVKKQYTDDPALHDTVVSSTSTGFYIENRTLHKESVEVYIYVEKTEQPVNPEKAEQPEKAVQEINPNQEES